MESPRGATSPQRLQRRAAHTQGTGVIVLFIVLSRNKLRIPLDVHPLPHRALVHSRGDSFDPPA